MSDVVASAISDTTEDLQNEEGAFRLKEQYIRVVLENATGLYSTEPISSADDAVRIMAQAISSMDREYFCVVNLNRLYQPIGYSIVGMGTVGDTLVSQSNLFRAALLSNAAAILVLHNHPSGNLRPSPQDLLLTAQINTLAKLFDLDFLDHVIVGQRNQTYSIRKYYPDFFTTESIDLLNRYVTNKTNQTKIRR